MDQKWVKQAATSRTKWTALTRGGGEAGPGPPQESAFGLTLFSLSISDLELVGNSVAATFANANKLFRLVKSKVDCEELQEGHSKLGKRFTT